MLSDQAGTRRIAPCLPWSNQPGARTELRRGGHETLRSVWWEIRSDPTALEHTPVLLEEVSGSFSRKSFAREEDRACLVSRPEGSLVKKAQGFRKALMSLQISLRPNSKCRTFRMQTVSDISLAASRSAKSGRFAAGPPRTPALGRGFRDQLGHVPRDVVPVIVALLAAQQAPVRIRLRDGFGAELEEPTAFVAAPIGIRCRATATTARGLLVTRKPNNGEETLSSEMQKYGYRDRRRQPIHRSAGRPNGAKCC
jgi:hypothetical protein